MTLGRRTAQSAYRDTHTALSSSSDESQLLEPYFFPPLYLQRRTFCLEVIKQEGVRSVVELGCGEGSLLSVLCEPSSHLDDFPPFIPPPLCPASPAHSSDGSTGVAAGSSDFVLSSFAGDGSSSQLAPSGSVVTPDEDDGLASGRIVDEGSFESHLQFLRRVPLPAVHDKQLHVERLYGLDISTDSLAKASAATAPPSSDAEASSWGARWERWERLKVELWQGSLEHYNYSFESVELIVASEVIEHLPDNVLSKFASVVLGRYSPRVVVVTTPNYDFNKYFPQKMKDSADDSECEAGEVDEDEHRFPDPTGRTDRVFRDSDHKFEWTQAEFERWAKLAADEYDYKVEFRGCGTYANYFARLSMTPNPRLPPTSCAPPRLPNHPHPEDPHTLFATQCAVFRRRFGNEPDPGRSPRSRRPSALPFFSPKSATFAPLNRHLLLTSHVHTAHPAANKPLAAGKVREAVEGVMKEWGATDVSLAQLWGGSKKVREAAGGAVRKVVEAIVLAQQEGKEADAEDLWKFEVRESEGRGIDAVWIVWKGGIVEGDMDAVDVERADELEMDEPLHDLSAPGQPRTAWSTTGCDWSVSSGGWGSLSTAATGSDQHVALSNTTDSQAD